MKAGTNDKEASTLLAMARFGIGAITLALGLATFAGYDSLNLESILIGGVYLTLVMRSICFLKDSDLCFGQ